nr:hypothetical protein [Tanacetum cinerariifolium]
SNTPPDSYSAASHFGGVTDWYQQPSPCEGRSGDVSPGEDGPPVMPEDPYAYVVAAFQALPSPNYVPGLEELEQAPPSPPLPAAALPTTDSPGYIPESDPDEDPEDDDDEDPEEDSADYLRLSIVHCPRYEAGESSAATVARPIEGRRADYGFVDSVEVEIRRRRAED